MAGENACPSPAQRARWLNGVAHAVASKDRLADGESMTPLDLHVALVLVHCYVNRDNGDAWPAQDRLAKDLGVTKRAVRKSLKRLTLARFITVQSRGYHETNMVRLNLDRVRADPRLAHSEGNGRSSQATAIERNRRSSHTATKMVLPGASHARQRGTAVPVRGEPQFLSRGNSGSPDSIGRTHLNDSSDSEDRANARISESDSDFEEERIRDAQACWNSMRLGIGADHLHRLNPKQREKLGALLCEFGIDGWRAIVGEIERDDFLAGRHPDAKRPVLLGYALRKAVMLLERARDAGHYTFPDDDLEVLS